MFQLPMLESRLELVPFRSRHAYLGSQVAPVLHWSRDFLQDAGRVCLVQAKVTRHRQAIPDAATGAAVLTDPGFEFPLFVREWVQIESWG